MFNGSKLQAKALKFRTRWWLGICWRWPLGPLIFMAKYVNQCCLIKKYLLKKTWSEKSEKHSGSYWQRTLCENLKIFCQGTLRESCWAADWKHKWIGYGLRGKSEHFSHFYIYLKNFLMRYCPKIWIHSINMAVDAQDTPWNDPSRRTLWWPGSSTICRQSSARYRRLETPNKCQPKIKVQPSPRNDPNFLILLEVGLTSRWRQKLDQEPIQSSVPFALLTGEPWPNGIDGDLVRRVLLGEPISCIISWKRFFFFLDCYIYVKYILLHIITILYYTILYYTILYYTILYNYSVHFDGFFTIEISSPQWGGLGGRAHFCMLQSLAKSWRSDASKQQLFVLGCHARVQGFKCFFFFLFIIIFPLVLKPLFFRTVFLWLKRIQAREGLSWDVVCCNSITMLSTRLNKAQQFSPDMVEACHSLWSATQKMPQPFLCFSMEMQAVQYLSFEMTPTSIVIRDGPSHLEDTRLF